MWEMKIKRWRKAIDREEWACVITETKAVREP
jgi:hypothetical protein